MKKSVRLFITGNLQSLFFRQHIKENADINNVKGFLRNREDGKVEIFLEGDVQDVDEMIKVCSTSPKFSTIRSVEQRDEKFQEFKDFKIFRF